MVIVTGCGSAMWNKENLNVQSAQFAIADENGNSLTAGGVWIGAQALVGRDTYNKYVRASLYLNCVDSPATTNAVTYKLQHRAGAADVTSRLEGVAVPTRMYAIELEDVVVSP